jgi:transposase-like protein
MNRRYSPDLIARAKGLMLVVHLPTKIVASLCGVSPDVVKRWRSGARNSHILPDESMREAMRALLAPNGGPTENA